MHLLEACKREAQTHADIGNQWSGSSGMSVVPLRLVDIGARSLSFHGD